MTTLKVGGVPEHFNLPWHLCMEEGLFEKAGLTIEWSDFPGGTGAMTRELRHNGLDVAIVLTEGMVADISLGNKTKILSFYTSTPLIWGLHTSAYNRFEVLKDVDPKVFAISRWGSGSHLMAHVLAGQKGLAPKKDIHFKVVSSLDGARESLAERTSNLFLWEKFTTKPFVDNGEFKRLTDVPTPWPCFVIAARQEVIKKYGIELKKMTEIVLKRANQMKEDAGTVELISLRYKLQEVDVQQWLSITQWEKSINPNEEALDRVIEKLKELEIIKSELTVQDLLTT